MRTKEQSGATTEIRESSIRWALLVLLLAGSALRFYGLGIQSFWNDELASWIQSHQATLAEVIETGVRPTTYPPAYQIFLYFVERYIGDSETILRFPSAVGGVLAILAMFFLGKRLYSTREALIVATLTTFSYQPIYYSQEARAYSFLFLFSILSANFWFRLLPRSGDSEPPSVGVQVGFVVTAIVTAYLHYFGLLLVALQLGGLWLLCIRHPRALARATILSLVVAASYLPWLPYLLEEFEREGIHILEPTLRTAIGYWRFLFYNPGDHLKWFAAALFFIAAARSLVEWRGSDPQRRAAPPITRTTALLIAWLVVPFAIAYTRSKLSLPMITDRNLIISLPAALLLFSRALTRTVTDSRLQAVTVVTIVAILLYGMFVTGGYYKYPRKEQFREAAAVVTEREHEFSNASVIAHAWSNPLFDYYLERQGAESRVDLLAGTAEDVPRLHKFLARYEPDYVWFLLGHRQPDPVFMDALDRELELVFHVPLYGAFTRLYRSRDASD